MTTNFADMDKQTIQSEATKRIYFEVPTDLKALGDDNFYRNVKRMYRKRNGRVDYARIYKDFPDFLVLVRLDFPEPIDEAQEQALHQIWDAIQKYAGFKTMKVRNIDARYEERYKKHFEQ
jgi:hypothetical protein